MKSRRRIASPQRLRTTTPTLPRAERLQQGFAASEMGFPRHIAEQQSETADVRFGSKATISAAPAMSALPPKATVAALPRNDALCH
jgi:hypothetical protein